MSDVKPEKNAFYHHLADAITINSERKKKYAEMTRNKSLWVSLPLIYLEKMSLIIARQIDRQAEKYQERGIPIIANDFVPMHPLPSYHSPPQYRQKADRLTLQQMSTILKAYRKRMKTCVDNGEFAQAARASYDTLQQIKTIEADHQCHFAMTRHLLESVGFAALHAVNYEKASGGETDPLAKKFINVQLMGISGGLWLDKQAQLIHQMGVGIIINDVPHIPFESEFEKNAV